MSVKAIKNYVDQHQSFFNAKYTSSELTFNKILWSAPLQFWSDNNNRHEVSL